MQSALILYHARCPDGMAAAWVTLAALKEQGYGDILAHAIDYGTEPPAGAAGREVFWVDFCPSDPRHLLEQAAVCPRVTVIDHHKTAPAVMAAVLTKCDNVKFVFDTAHSGGRLAWKHFRGIEPPPNLVLYTEDADLFHWKLPNSRAVSGYLTSLPWGDFDAWGEAAREMASDPPDRSGWDSRIVAHGKTVLACNERVIEDHKRAAFETELAGHEVLAVNCSVAAIHSELTGRLAAGRPFGISWFVRGDGLAQISLRSRGTNSLDVSAIAKSFGGGGHAQAAGFQAPADRLPFAVPGGPSGGPREGGA